jgi:hypothetical protein
MRKIAIVGVAVFAMATSAQVLQCPNPDILNGLVFLGRSEMKMTVTRGSSGFMGDFRSPTGFSLIGAGTRAPGMSVVAYKTSLAGEKAYAALLAALSDEGWAIESTPGSGSTFNVAGSPREGTVCRKGERRTLLVTESGGLTYASIVAATQRRTRDCNTPDPNLGMSRRQGMPRFQFPAGTSLAQGGGGGGGSDRNYTTSSRVISSEAAARLVEYLVPQMEAQGWRADSGWAGTGSAGSAWHKIIDGEPAIGVLEIVRVSEGTYEVNFSVATSD